MTPGRIPAPVRRPETIVPARRQIVLATTNPHKVHELIDILAPLVERLRLDVLSAADFPDVPDVAETEVTFTGNATLKARALAEATGLPALADDSGLAVDVLGGSPGVFSARWSGLTDMARPDKDRANLELLLAQLSDVPGEHRAAAFVCAAVIALPDGQTAAREGRVAGSIGRAPVGDNGFGYDPIFLVAGDEQGRTMAQLTDAQKNAISHRGLAFTALLPEVERLLGE